MNRYVLLMFAQVALLSTQAPLHAQPANGQMTISTVPSGARFYVDGQQYSRAVTFLWPAGSKHIAQFPVDNPVNGGPASTIQTSPDGSFVWTFGGWKDSANILFPASNLIQTITADPNVTSLTAQLTVSFRINLQFFSPLPTNAPAPVCGSPGTVPTDQARPGIVIINGTCFDGDGAIYLPAGVVNINAFPYPGYVFLGWGFNSIAPSNAYLRSYNITQPQIIRAVFIAGKRVNFVTNPPLLQILVDHTAVPTPPVLPCPGNWTLAPIPFSSVTPLCVGSFDFAPGSTHVIGAPSPQMDNHSNYWVFSGFSDGLAPNAIYTTDYNIATADNITANFIPGAIVDIASAPFGLPLTVDGRSKWPTYGFIWGVGTTHTVSAEPTLTDANGRNYTFKSWSNGGPASQTFTVAMPGIRLVANYNKLNRLVLQGSQAGVVFTVDGAACPSPCSVDRAGGTQVQVQAPAKVSLSNSARLDFVSWGDGGSSIRNITLNSDLQNLSANYNLSFLLTTSSDPANQATFLLNPASADGFFTNGTQVTVTAQPKPGYRFRRWEGDLSGTYASGTVTLSGGMAVLAHLDSVPFVPPAGIKNAAGDPPDGGMAPGSIIAIYGTNIAPDLKIGPVNPVGQTLDGVTVQVTDRLLPLLFVSPGQINALLPSDLATGNYTLTIHSDSQPDVTGTFTIVRNAPGLFANVVGANSFIVAKHADGSSVSSDHPAAAGETITVIGTGFGPLDHKFADGFAIPKTPQYKLADTVDIIAGASHLQPTWAGALPGTIGLEAVTFKVTTDLPSGTNVSFHINVNGKASNAVLLPVQ